MRMIMALVVLLHKDKMTQNKSRYLKKKVRSMKEDTE